MTRKWIRRRGRMRRSRTRASAASRATCWMRLFMDGLSQDLERLTRVNTILEQVPGRTLDTGAAKLRYIDALIMLPSRDIREIAVRHVHEMPRPVQLLMSGLGALNYGGRQLVSYLLFEQGYTLRADQARLRGRACPPRPAPGVSRGRADRMHPAASPAGAISPSTTPSGSGHCRMPEARPRSREARSERATSGRSSQARGTRQTRRSRSPSSAPRCRQGRGRCAVSSAPAVPRNRPAPRPAG